MSGRVEYLFNQCGKGGCWVTSEERALANAGKWNEYYQLACSNGDGYACRAGEVARMEGTLAQLTNLRLNASINSSNIWMSGDELSRRTESIRVGLAQEHVLALDATGATEANPNRISRSTVADFHRDVFMRNGAGDVFGGKTWDRWLGKGGLGYDWCKSCSP